METILNNKIQESGLKEEKKIVITGRSQEDDLNAQKAAARALEMAFLRKKEVAKEEKEENEEKEEKEVVDEVEEVEEAVPIPAKRQSVKKADGGESVR